MQKDSPGPAARTAAAAGMRDEEDPSVPRQVHALEIGGEEEEAPRIPKLRLHYLDWLRLLLVVCVVYAHTAKSGLSGGGGFNESWLVDDRTLFDSKSYRDLVGRGGANGWPKPVTGPAPLAVRWISIVRQWCLPLLFWVSGASAACSYRGGMPRGMDKLLLFSAIGMALNAALWFLGPLDDRCVIDSPKCVNKGLIFNFTIVPWAGMAFAIVFQMWYTMVLVILLLLNWPLFATSYVAGGRHWVLGIQWAVSMALYTALVVGSGGACKAPVQVLCSLGGLEAAFLVLGAAAAPGWKGPRWLPVRAAHYLLALVTILQFGALPYAQSMNAIGLTYLSYIVTGFNRFFGLGFIMTRARLGPKGDEVERLMSRAWPLMLLLITMVAPSTNWDLAGLLTFPYFRAEGDRCLYVGGGVVVAFVLDRCSRGVECDPLPNILGYLGLLLYLFHPVLITFFLSLGLRSVPQVWLSSLAAATLQVFLMCSCRRAPSSGRRRSEARRREDVGATTGDSSTEAEGVM